MNETQKIQFLVWFLNNLLKNFKLRITSLGLVCKTNNSGVEKELLLSTDWKVAFEFLKIDYNAILYDDDITEETMFVMLTESEYFNPDLVVFKASEIKNYSVFVRHMIISFRNHIQTLKVAHYEDLYFAHTSYTYLYDLILENYFEISKNNFQVYQDVLTDVIKPKFNFNLVKELLQLTEKKTQLTDAFIGGVYEGFLLDVGIFHDQYLFNNTKEQIESDFLEWYK